MPLLSYYTIFNINRRTFSYHLRFTGVTDELSLTTLPSGQQHRSSTALQNTGTHQLPTRGGLIPRRSSLGNSLAPRQNGEETESIKLKDSSFTPQSTYPYYTPFVSLFLYALGCYKYATSSSLFSPRSSAHYPCGSIG